MDERWRDRAACRDKPASWWIGDLHTDESLLARTLCAGCPVRAECAGAALAYLDEDPRKLTGIWAGVVVHTRTSNPRTKLRRLAMRDISLQNPRSPG